MVKAQISLEMIVMLVVLLVLAGVIIFLITHFLSTGTFERLRSSTELEKKRFFSQCEEYCKDPNSIEYCRAYYDKDWDGDGTLNVISVGKYNWYACEGRIYCFLVYPCEDRFGKGLETIKKCKQLLCQTYYEKYEDMERANRALFNDIRLPPGCDWTEVRKKEGEDNWFDRFFGTDCSGRVYSSQTTSPINEIPSVPQ